MKKMPKILTIILIIILITGCFEQNEEILKTKKIEITYLILIQAGTTASDNGNITHNITEFSYE